MELSFDISPEEMPIFLAETDEHIQVLDEGLVRLEKEHDDADLLQAMFRGAHTLKGAAGMIGHKRMVELTHSLEAVLDGVRKGTLTISAPLIDQCLKSLDAIKSLRDEVATGKYSGVEVDELVAGLQPFIQGIGAASASGGVTPTVPPALAPTREREKISPPQRSSARSLLGDMDLPAPDPARGAARPTIPIRADISSNSMTSAARALQVLLALQSLGEIASIQPSQEQIETAAPVSKVTAALITTRPLQDIQKALLDITDVERVVIAGEEFTPKSLAEETASAREEPPRLGDFLLTAGLITSEQLERALAIQKNKPGQLLGQALVQSGAITHAALDDAIAHQFQQMRTALTSAQNGQQDKTRPRVSEKTVRVSVERLDSLMNMVGELITDRNRLYRVRADLEEQLRSYNQAENLVQTVTHIGRITDQLQEEVMRIRMLPVADVFNKYPRMIRDLARQSGKQVDLVVRGEDTELDRSVIEKISDPLIHLLRNSVDHGVETPSERIAHGKSERGSILLAARHENGQIILTVQDDGNGIDTKRVKAGALRKGLITDAEAAAMTEEEAIELIFKPGLSTASKVTDISGRGVGMDIVRANIEQLNGTVLIDTRPGEGTRFQIVLPLTLAIVPTLLVQVGASTFAIPLVTVNETLRIDPKDIRAIKNKPIIMIRNSVLPLMRLSEAFGLESADRNDGYEYVVAVRSGKSMLGLMVDSFLGEQELTVKSLGALTGKTTGISGAAILGDGLVTLIVDVQALFRLAGVHQFGLAGIGRDGNESGAN
jgi:two-component system, chemotaxis family, sensor kinase CheA